MADDPLVGGFIEVSPLDDLLILFHGDEVLDGQTNQPAVGMVSPKKNETNWLGFGESQLVGR